MRRLAIKSALSDKVANEKLIVVKDLTLEEPRTKDMLAILESLPGTDTAKRVLMMLPKRDENVVLSARNIPSAKVQHVSCINVVELLKHDCVIMPVKTVRWIEMVFGEGLSADEASERILAELAEETANREAAEEEESTQEELSEGDETAEEEAVENGDEEAEAEEPTASDEEE
jgi:large subunit ribosomal protein L4